MNEEALRKEFEEWAIKEECDIRRYSRGQYVYLYVDNAWLAWLESARRADRRARDDCARVCRSVQETGLSREEINRNLLRGNPDGKTEGFQKGVDECYAAILATIKDQK